MPPTNAEPPLQPMRMRSPRRSPSVVVARGCLRLVPVIFCVLAVGACAGPGSTAGADGATNSVPAPSLPPAARSADFLLIGEVHDNVEQHRLRLHWLAALADVHPFALALEQFDADRQEALDRARAIDAREARGPSAPDLATRARRVAEAAGFDFEGWDWDLYRPPIELALRRGLPLIAANLSPADTTRVTQQRAPAAPPPPGWADEDAEAMRASIRKGHCGLLPERAVDAMAVAQRTRDARIAQALVDAHARTGLPVVLLAGNGHLRRDIGVPRHLAVLRPDDRIVSIALLERDSAEDRSEDATARAEGAPYDLVVRTPGQPREDPCVKLRERLRR